MRYGIVLSLVLHVLVIVPLLFVYTSRPNEPAGRETPPTRYVAQTVNIEALRPEPMPVAQPEPPPSEEPEIIVSEAEQATTVAPVEPETIEPTEPEPPPEQVTMQEPEPNPLPDLVAEEPPPPEVTATEPEPIPAPVPEPEPIPEPEPRLEPKPEPPPEPEPPERAVKPQTPVTAQAPPPNQQAMIDHQPTRGSPSSGNTSQEQSGEATPDQRADYFAELRTWLEQHKQYPYMAQRMRQEGTVQLRFVMDREGNVLSWSIDQSSGYSALDGEVEELILRADPLPPLPDEMPEAKVEMVVPVSFFLQ